MIQNELFTLKQLQQLGAAAPAVLLAENTRKPVKTNRAGRLANRRPGTEWQAARSTRRSKSSSDFRLRGKLGKTPLVQRMRKRLRHLLNPTRGRQGGNNLAPTPTRRRIKREALACVCALVVTLFSVRDCESFERCVSMRCGRLRGIPDAHDSNIRSWNSVSSRIPVLLVSSP